MTHDDTLYAYNATPESYAAFRQRYLELWWAYQSTNDDALVIDKRMSQTRDGTSLNASLKTQRTRVVEENSRLFSALKELEARHAVETVWMEREYGQNWRVMFPRRMMEKRHGN